MRKELDVFGIAGESLGNATAIVRRGAESVLKPVQGVVQIFLNQEIVRPVFEKLRMLKAKIRYGRRMR